MKENDVQITDPEIYCRKLGHHLRFSYCQNENHGRICMKIRDCWWQRLDINSWLQENYSEEDLQHLDKLPQPKVSTLLELIQKAQKLSA